MTSHLSKAILRRFEATTAQLRSLSTTSNNSQNKTVEQFILPQKIDDSPKEDLSNSFEIVNSNAAKFRGSNFNFPCLNRRFIFFFFLHKPNLKNKKNKKVLTEAFNY